MENPPFAPHASKCGFPQRVFHRLYLGAVRAGILPMMTALCHLLSIRRSSLILVTSVRLLACWCVFAASHPAQAADGAWNVDAAGNWNVAGSWLDGVIPGSTSTTDSTDIATFGLSLTAGRIVTVDTNRNIGGITFSNGSAFGYTLSGGSLRLSSGGLIQTLATGIHTDTIGTAITLLGDATFAAGSTARSVLSITGAVTGTGNIVLDNDGGIASGVTLASANHTGTITNSGSGFGTVGITGAIGVNVTGVVQNSLSSGLRLAGANLYTSATTLTAGQILVARDSVGTVGSITSSAVGRGSLIFNGGMISSDGTAARTLLNAVSFTANGGIGDIVANGALTFLAGVDLGVAVRRLAVNSAATVSGVITNGGLTKGGAGVLTLNGSAVNTFTGGLSLTGGGLTLDFANLATPTHLIDSGNTLGIAGGGALLITAKSSGSTTQIFGNVTVGAGGGSLLVNPNGGTGTTLALGTLNATTSGGSLLIGRAIAAGAGTLTITTSSDKDMQGIYGGRIVFANGTANTGYDWATTTSGAAPFTLSAFSGYSALTLTAGTDTLNSRITASQTLSGSRTTNTLKIENPAASQTLALGANTLTLSSGGLLVTGTNATTLSGTAGGTRLTAGNGSGSYDLIVHQYNSGGLTISAVIGDNGGNAVSLVKAGNGILTLSGANTHSGGTIASAGTLTLGSTSALGTGVLTIEQGASLSAASNVTTNANNNAIIINGNVNIAGGGLNLGTGAVSLGTGEGNARLITVAGSFTSEGSTWTLGGNITDGIAANSLIKLGNGGLRLAGVNSYTGTTTVNGGTLIITTTAALPGWDVNGRWSVSASGTLAFGNAVSDGEIATMLGTTNFRANAALGFDTFTGHRTYSGNINGTPQGGLGLRTTGRGTLTLTGNNTFTSSILITTELAVGSANALAGGGAINNLGVLSVTNALGSATINNNFNVNGSVTFGSSANSGTLVLSGILTPNAVARTITVAAGTTVEITGTIADIAGVTQTLFTKAGAGTLVYNSSTNAYEGGTAVSGGTLLLKGANTMPTLGTLAVTVGGNFSLADGAARNTSVPALNLGTGSNLSFDWNAGAVDALTSTAAAVTAGNVGIALNPTNTPTGSGLTLLSSSGGLNTANYFLINNTDFTATLTQSATAVTVSAFSAVTAPTTFYWQGNRVLGSSTAGVDNALTFSNGTASNWSTTQGSYTATALVPGSAASLIFSATGAAQQNAVLGADLEVNSITFNDSTAVTLGGSHTLTLLSTGTGAESAIVVNSTSAATTTISTANGVILGADQTWTIASGKTLTVSVSIQGGQSLIKDGAGTLNFTGGSNTYVGTTTVNAGTLSLGKSAGVNAIVGNLIIGDGTGGDIVQLNASNQIQDFSIITLNGTGADAGIFRLNNQSEIVGGLSSTGGAGIVENGAAGAGTSIMTAGVLSGTQSFSGILRNNGGSGSGVLAFSKEGIGTQILTGTSTYTGVTTVNNGILQLGNGGTTGSIAGSSSIHLNSVTGTLRTNRSDSHEIHQAITGPGHLEIANTGAGSTRLSSAANNYSGTTTVTNGALQVGSAGVGRTGTGDVTAQTGSTILGTGFVQGSSFTAQSGSTIHAGDGTAAGDLGTLTFTPVSGSGSIDFQSGSNVNLCITPGGTSDQLKFIGTGSNTLLFNSNLTIGPASFTPIAGEVFQLLDWSGLSSAPTFAAHFTNNLIRNGSADNGSAWDLPDISSAPEFFWDLSNFTNNGSIAIVVIPEPSRAVLLLFGVLGFLLRRRRA